jgi:capsular polysaccharide biosynthesis protein
VNEEDQAVMRLVNGSADGAGPTWPYDDSAAAEPQSTGFAAELVSLSYIKSALRRGARLWCSLAIIGMIMGLGYTFVYPTPYQATTTILLPLDVTSDGAILSDAAIAQSYAVARLAEQKLGLTQSLQSFAKTYTVTPPTTDEVMVITVTAASPQAALNKANAVAAAFLEFRAKLETTEQNIAVTSLGQQARQAKQQVQSLTKQIADLTAQTSTASSQTKLNGLESRLGQANDDLTNANSGIHTTELQTTLQNKESQVLDAASLIPKSRKKPILIAAAIGLFAGLVPGIGILAIRAVVSDRLRRRDDVAHAIGAPVRLSVGAIRSSRWRPFRADLAASTNPGVRLVVAQLRAAVPQNSPKPAALAVVPVDDPQGAAVCVASLATLCAQEGMHVVLADLTSGMTAGRLFGVKRPGVLMAGEPGSRLVVAIPDPANPAPVGPRPGLGALAYDKPARELAEACAAADLLLVLAPLDPSLGGDHLATWASDAVAVVTAGRSSWTKIHAVAEMLRLAQIRVASAVLVGADSSDDSIGVLQPVEAGRPDGLRRQRVADAFEG